MRSFLCHIIMLSVLFMSVDGAADIASSGHPHGDNVSTLVDAQPTPSLDAPSGTDADPTAEHCEHCCHGHMVSIAEQIISNTPPWAASDQPSSGPLHCCNVAQAPPTPPPTA